MRRTGTGGAILIKTILFRVTSSLDDARDRLGRDKKGKYRRDYFVMRLYVATFSRA